MKKYSKPTIRSKKISAKLGSRNKSVYGAIEDLLISDVYANTIFIPMIMSDMRSKTGVKPVGNALRLLKNLSTVTYRYHTHLSSDGKKRYGVLAQQVAEIYPELVGTVDENGMMAVDYSGLTAVLIQAVNELERKNELLTSQLLKLQKQVRKRPSTA